MPLRIDEFELKRLLAKGEKIEEIARLYDVSRRTVSRYIKAYSLVGLGKRGRPARRQVIT